MRVTLTEEENALVCDARRKAQELGHEFVVVRVTNAEAHIVSGSKNVVDEFIRTVLPDETLLIFPIRKQEEPGHNKKPSPVPRPYAYSDLYE